MGFPEPRLPDGRILGRCGDMVDAGVPTYVERHGAGPPLVLLHGGLATMESLYFLVRGLMADFTVIVPERRGHGRSPDVAGAYGYDLLAGDLIALMAALEIPRAHLVGWSDGGVVALTAAAREPGLCDRLALIGAGADAEAVAPGFRDAVEAAGPDDVAAMVRQTWAATAPDPAAWPAVFAKVRAMWLAPHRIADADLARLANPVLVMSGDRDMVPLDHVLDLYRKLPAGQMAVIPGADHMMPVTRPEPCVAALRAFLLHPADPVDPTFGLFGA